MSNRRKINGDAVAAATPEPLLSLAIMPAAQPGADAQILLHSRVAPADTVRLLRDVARRFAESHGIEDA